MFEATFRIAARVVSNEQGQPVFQVTKQEAPFNEQDFPKMLATVYQQEVVHLLRAGDNLAIKVHLDLPTREMERIVRFREDQQFEEEGVQQPIPNPLAIADALYEQFMRQVHVGDVLTVAFQVQRL